MTSIRRAHQRRSIALVAALVAGAGGSIALAVASPAQAATQTINIKNVAYTCKADLAIVDSVLGGPQSVTVEATSTVPDQIDGGGTIASTKANLTLTLSKTFVATLRDKLKIEKVRGTSGASVDLAAVAAANKVVANASAPVNGLAVPNFTAVPAKGAATQTLDLDAVGTIPDVQVPAFNGIAYILMPKTFTLQSEVTPPVLGSIDKVDLTCTRTSDSLSQRIIGQITVGTGCAAGEVCSLDPNAVPGDPTTAPTDDPTTTPTDDPTTDPTDDPTTTPTDDPTSDPTSPTSDPTDVAAGGGTQDPGGFVIGASQTAPTRTVASSDELPATGSPVGWLTLAALLLLGAGRVAMGLQGRRAAGE